MKILEFKKGDIITRTEPTITRRSGSFMISDSIEEDFSLVGKKFEFIGIANGLIYCARLDDTLLNSIEFYLSNNIEGWEYWIEPESL